MATSHDRPTPGIAAALRNVGRPSAFLSSPAQVFRGRASLMLLVVGSFVAQGEMDPCGRYWWREASVQVIGDQIGFFAGRYGGRVLVRRVQQKRVGGHAGIQRAEAFTKRWGSPAIFFSRWLVTPAGSLDQPQQLESPIIRGSGSFFGMVRERYCGWSCLLRWAIPSATGYRI